MYPRAKTFGIALHHNRLLVQEYYTGYDTYYRPLGGSIEQGEKSSNTIIREFNALSERSLLPGACERR